VVLRPYAGTLVLLGGGGQGGSGGSGGYSGGSGGGIPDDRGSAPAGGGVDDEIPF